MNDGEEHSGIGRYKSVSVVGWPQARIAVTDIRAAALGRRHSAAWPGAGGQPRGRAPMGKGDLVRQGSAWSCLLLFLGEPILAFAAEQLRERRTYRLQFDRERAKQVLLAHDRDT